MQKLFKTILIPTIATLLVFGLAQGASIITPIFGGGTGTSTAPTAGQLLMGNSAGKYDLVSTSSLGITSQVATTTFNSILNYGNGTTTGNQVISGNLNVGGNITGNGALLTGITGGYFIPSASGLYYSSSTKPNVAIGTTTPMSLFHIYSSTTLPLTITVATTNTAVDPGILFRGGGLTPSTLGTIYFDDSDSDKFKIATSTSAIPFLSIGSTGQVFQIPDHSSTSMEIKQADESYLTFDTSNNAEKMIIGKDLESGIMQIDQDSGQVQFVNMNVTATSSAGTAQSLSLAIDGMNILTVYASSTGNGLIENMRVGIGTTTPIAMLSVIGNASTTGDLLRISTSSIYSMVIDGMGKIGIGTTTPYEIFDVLGNVRATNFYGNGGTLTGIVVGATTTFNSITTSGVINQTNIYSHFGNATSASTCSGYGTCLEVIGNEDSNKGSYIQAGNISASTSAYTGITLINDIADSTLNHYAGIFLNSSNYSDTYYGTANAKRGLLNIQNTDGPINMVAATTSAEGYISFATGGQNVENEKVRITSAGNLEVSTANSTLASPRTIGITNLTSGTAGRIQFGDEHNAFQTGYAKDMTMYSYWAIVLTGGMQNYNAGFKPAGFTQNTDVGTLIVLDNFIGDDPGAGATLIDTLAVKATTSQTTNLVSLRDSLNNKLSVFNNVGWLGIGTSTPVHELEVVGTTKTTALRLVNTWHTYGGFQQSTTSITCAQNVWSKVTNATNDLWVFPEAVGFTTSSDDIVITNAGDYYGTLTLSVSGANGDDYFIRMYNASTTAQVGYYIGATMTGATNYTPISLPIYIEDNVAGNHYQIQIENISNNNDPVVRSAVLYLNYLHE